MAPERLRQLLEDAAAAYQLQEFETARDRAFEACQVAPDSIDAWDFHGMASQELGDIPAAERSYERALKLAQDAYVQHHRDDKLALRQIFLLMRLGRDAEVETLFTTLNQRHPDSAGLRKLMAAYRMKRR